jgi:predicted DNA-binding transcriptional regulator YafY
LDLLQLLRRHRAPVTGPALARELGISIRTLYRDIAMMQAQGPGIQGEPGVGYTLRPGLTLPPLMFSADEIEALALGAHWMAVRGDARLGAAANNAVAKIRAVLPDDLRGNVDAATMTVPEWSPIVAPTVDVSVIRGAIRAERKLAIAYRGSDGTATRRTIWPNTRLGQRCSSLLRAATPGCVQVNALPSQPIVASASSLSWLLPPGSFRLLVLWTAWPRRSSPGPYQ